MDRYVYSIEAFMRGIIIQEVLKFNFKRVKRDEKSLFVKLIVKTR